MIDITNNQKSIQAIMNTDKEFLSPADIAPILGSDPQTIRDTARQRPELLGFEFTFVGNRMKIPRTSFLRWLGINHNEKVIHTSICEENSGSVMTNEQVFIAITHEINTFKQEIFERLDTIESQTQDLNNILQAAGAFINALARIACDRDQ